MSLPVIHSWIKAPFIRLLIPLIVGIVLQCQIQLQVQTLWIAFIIAAVLLFLFFFVSFFEKYKFSTVNGFAIALLFISLGSLLTWNKDIRHHSNWFGKNYKNEDALIVTLIEKLVEKDKSYKANVSVDFIFLKDSVTKTKGTLIVYFKKDNLASTLHYGSQLIINKSIQEIKNSGNPGGFDYKRYSLFQGITHQVYLKENEFKILPGKHKNRFTEFIITIREEVLQILRDNIKGEKELGLAEALLIGYKDDLDKTLVQSYSNTGVVHVIAISGLHLGLIYWLLFQLFLPLQRKKKLKWLRPILIIAGLWLFSLLAGAQPSVLRSAVMFTCIALGEAFARKASIYNTLAFSAFLLLCINPYWLWDVGFQLSYMAVLSIVIFMRPIYNWFYIKNKALDFIWKLTAVSLAAQILTAPVSIYHFHQFPFSFLFTNFLAVPLSSLIILGEILLCVVSFIPFIAVLVGKILIWLIWIMNTYVERIEKLPYLLWDGLQINIVQAICLLAAAASLGYWLMEKNKTGFKIGLVGLFVFFSLRSIYFIKANSQQKIIVYNVPRKMAIDIVDARKYLFIGDSDLLADDFVRNFHIKPSRIKNRIEPSTHINGYYKDKNLMEYNGKKIMILDKPVNFSSDKKLTIDLLIISGNPKLFISKLSKTFSIHQIVFDGSVASWKINHWQKDCNSLQIPYHDVSEKGAFVMNLR